MPMAMINQNANSAYQLDQILQRIQLFERKLSTDPREHSNHIILLINIANELGTDVLDARCYHRLFDKVLHILQHYENDLKNHAAVVDSVYSLCSRVICKLVISPTLHLEEIGAIHNPTKAVFFNLLAYQLTQASEYLLEALVFSTRDDYNLEYLVQTVNPFLLNLPPNIILDCLVERSNYRAQEYYFEALLEAEELNRSVFIEALARFRPGSDITRLLQLLLSNTSIEGCWKHILLISNFIEESVFEQLIVSLLQSDNLLLDDLRSITQFVIQTSDELEHLAFNPAIIKKLLIKTEHPSDNPTVFQLLPRLEPIERDVIAIQLIEMYLKSKVELNNLVPFVRQLSNNHQVAEAIWKHYSAQRVDNLDNLPFDNNVFVGLINSETSSEIILALYPRIDSYSELKTLSNYFCDYEMLVKLLSFLNDLCAAEELEYLINLMNVWITDSTDKEALTRKLVWHAQGLLDKTDRSRVLELLNHHPPAVDINSYIGENSTTTDLHHLLVFNTFQEE